MKVKRILAGILTSAAFLTTLSLCVSAASSIETQNRDWTMNKSYSKTTGNKVGYMYYHVGSTNWYDDVSAYTQTNLAAGMTGYASASVKADNNQIATRYADNVIHSNGSYYIRTDNAVVSGTDQAEHVRFMGARKDKKQDYVGFNYYIH